jgi:hypothetical protein
MPITPSNGLMAIAWWLPAARVDCSHPITPLESGQKRPQTDYRDMARGSHGQGRSQTVSGVTVVTGPRRDPMGTPRRPMKGPGKEAAQERAVKTKVGAVCLLEK